MQQNETLIQGVSFYAHKHLYFKFLRDVNLFTTDTLKETKVAFLPVPIASLSSYRRN